MERPLRIAVIGLGRHWRRRYRPALQAMPDCFQVRAVYDQVQERAERESRLLRCEAPPAVMPLLERDDIDAFLLADPQWFGGWPLTAVGRMAKPVYCSAAMLDDAVILSNAAAESGPAVMVELLPRFAPAGACFHDSLRDQLGSVRWVACEQVRSGANSRPQPAPLTASSWIGLLDWCQGFVEGEPVSVLATGLEDGSFESIFLEFSGGRAVHVVQRRERHGAARLRLRVAAEQGPATLTLPRRVSWNGPEGRHVYTLPRGQPLSWIALQHFYQAVRTGQPLEPGWEAVRRPLAWLQAARQSWTEGRRVAWQPA
jgi:predicted dehydrogenase